ncbi:MAG: phosphodiester glycosidase family protein [Candidatus Bipolaricaulota bacterium]|nr:phosphodiester glycosidase family protein [Candidatus Bipolaricaulota bacterium]MDW8031667.1 phosphodiester glycosidase family protein [Candidatus Bipolaricaulota bacterium]
MQLAPAQAPQFFLNTQPISLKNRALVEGDHVFVPLVEFARLLGAEATVSYESVTLRWGHRESATISTEQLVARGPLLYISLAQLAQLLSIKTVKVGHAYYLVSTPARMLSITVASGGVFFTLSTRVPFELHKQNNIVTVRFFHTISELAHPPIKLTQESPIILRAHLQIDTSQTVRATAVESENFIVWVRAAVTDPEPRALLRIESQMNVQEDILSIQARALTADGPVSIHLLKIQNWKENYRLIVTLPRDGIGALEPLEKMAAHAVAAINANFFDPTTQLPLGLLVKDGVVHSAPYGRRGALAISLFNDLYFIAPTLKLSALVLGQPVMIDGVNRPPTAHGLFLYTDRYALPIRSEAPMKAVRLRHSLVVAVTENGLILPDGASTLLVATGAARSRLGGLRPGESVYISYTLDPGVLFLREAISAGPLLLQEGRLVLDPRAERFSDEFVKAKAARSVIALTESGDLLLIVVLKDMRSVGVDLHTLAILARSLGAHSALALDGGSSSTLLFRQGATVHIIGGRRPIAAGLAVVPKR